jgi:hypothetical protein
MTEQEYIDRIKLLIPDEGDVSLEALQLVEDGLREHPMSEHLWIWKGVLIQLGPENTPYEQEEVLASYQKAIRINPHSVESHREIGHFYDAVMDDEAKAQEWFSKAEELNGRR